MAEHVKSEAPVNGLGTSSRSDIKYVQYSIEQEAAFLDAIRLLISKDLSGM